MRKNIGFFILNVENLSGGNGAERFFADLYKIYKQQANPAFNLFFITDSIENYQLIGKFTEKDPDIILLNYARKWFRNKYEGKPVVVRKTLRFLILLAAYAELLVKLVRHRIDALHLCLYVKFDYPFVRFVDRWPSFLRPKIILNVVDHLIPYYYYRDEEDIIKTSAHRFHHEQLFNNVKIDGVYTWYENVKRFFEETKVIRSNPPVRSITSRFVLNHSSLNGQPKKNHIVFAGRLNNEKKPLFFLEAIRLLVQRDIAGVSEWKFRIYGRGYLEEEVRKRIAEYGLQQQVELSYHTNMGEVFAETKCFVSTQDFENFPSMAMAEAMINKNVIIARNVGQTELFVKPGVNGILIHPDSEEGLCNALEEYIVNNRKYSSFGEESLKLMQTVHTPENFIVQIDSFWQSILN
jgi:glycosyltransferase involved in cell wall biosynthesis